MSSPTKNQTYFPAGETPHFSLQNIRRRFMRKPPTVLSIILVATFIATLLTTTSILQAASKQSGGVTLRPEAYQYWLMITAVFAWGVVVNSMVMSTTERVREIGIMKSLGATNTTIIKMLLIDSASIGLLGGTFGAIIGWLIAIAIYSLQLGFVVVLIVPLPIHLFNLVLAVTASLLLSITATAYPAYQVAKLRPVDALKRET